jgi:hypothetical protein
MYVHTTTFLRLHTCTQTHVRSLQNRSCACMHTYIYIYIYTYIHTYIYIHIWQIQDVSAFVYARTGVFHVQVPDRALYTYTIHTYIHAYIHTHTHTYMFIIYCIHSYASYIQACNGRRVPFITPDTVIVRPSSLDGPQNGNTQALPAYLSAFPSF